MSTPAPILVLGAGGSVGGAVVAALARAGVPVRAASRRPVAACAPVVEPRATDLRDARACAEALAGVRRLFLLTPLEQDMTAVAARLLEQAAAAGVEYVVRLSALGAGEPPRTRLGAVHRETERALERLGIPFASLRPNAFMQNFVTQLGAEIRADNVFRACQGEGRVSMVDARDVADIAAALLGGEGTVEGAFELTGPQALSHREAAAVLSRVLGRRIEYVDEPAAHTRIRLAGAGLAPWLIDIVMELYAFSAAGGAATLSDDTARLLGRRPRTFEAFVRDHVGALGA